MIGNFMKIFKLLEKKQVSLIYFSFLLDRWENSPKRILDSKAGIWPEPEQEDIGEHCLFTQRKPYATAHIHL
jgi:hypothetical protein